MTATNEVKTCSFCYAAAVVRTRYKYRVVNGAKPGETIKIRSTDREPWFACEEHRKSLGLSELVEIKPATPPAPAPTSKPKRNRDIDCVWAFREHHDNSFCPARRVQLDIVAEFWSKGSLLGFFKVSFTEFAFCPWRSTVMLDGHATEILYDTEAESTEQAECEAVEKIFLLPCAMKYADAIEEVKFHRLSMNDVELLGW